MDKAEVIRAIVAALTEDYETFLAASRQSRSEGNDQESRSEGKYDTRSIETNYLADGQARRAAVAAAAAAAFRALPVREFAPADPVDLGALVEVSLQGEPAWFLVGPASGGLEVSVDAREITVITPEAPLGAQLMGRRQGETLPAARAKILSVR